MISRIEDAVRIVRADDPLLPVAVVVPSHLLGAWLAPRLFAGTGHLAIDFVLLHELAQRIAEPRLLAEGRTLAPVNVDLALLLAAAAEAVRAEETPEYLRGAVLMRGFGPAALRTLRDLADTLVAPEALEAAERTAVDSDRVMLLARLARGFEERLRAAGLVDRARLYREAVLSLPSTAVGGVVLCDPEDVPPVALPFLEALGRAQPMATVALRRTDAAPRRHARAGSVCARLGAAKHGAAADDQRAAAVPASSLERVQRGVFARRATNPGAAAPLDATLTILAAAGEGLEAVEIARMVRRATQAGIPLNELAVFLHDWHAYAAHLASAFARAGLDACLFAAVPRVDAAARALGLLLNLVGGELDRRAVMEFLTTARVPFEAILGKGDGISPAHWDRLSAEAGIVEGRASWRGRLQAKRADLARMTWEDDVRRIDALGETIERLADDLAAFPEAGSWADFQQATLHLLDTWIERGTATRERIERVIGPLAAHAPDPTRDQFLARLRDLIATQVYTEGALADLRVLVAPIHAARGVAFRLVFVPGLVERSFPAPARPDPLLLDEERERLSPDLATTRDAAEEERLLFLDALGAATERIVLSYPRFDSAKARVRYPSSFLLQAAFAATGRRTSADELARMAEAGETGLGRAYPIDPEAAIDTIERDLALVASGRKGAAAHLARAGETLARVIQLDRAAAEPRLTPFDGLVEVTAGGRAERLVLAGQRTSATNVQNFAGCPYRHLLARGFSLRKWEEPEHVYQLDGKAWGSLYHAVVARLFGSLRDDGALPLRRECLARIEERAAAIIDEVAQAAVEQGAILNAKLIEPAKGFLRIEIAELLQREAASDDGFVPIAFEERYEGLEIEIAPGRSVAFQGYLDRIDEKPGPRTVRVVDYKTGRSPWKEGEQLRGGRELQLAIYNEAVQKLHPQAVVAEARYYFSTSAARFVAKACPATPEIAQALRAVLQALDETAQAGVFAPVPDTCDYCDFTAICGNAEDRQRRFERKQADPRLATFLKIRGIA